MSKYTPINGWTRESMKARIMARNTGVPARDGTGIGAQCVYLTADGKNACAVGCFIDPAHDATLYVGIVYKMLCTYPELIPSMPLGSAGLSDMQAVHDATYSDEDIRVKLCAWIDVNVGDP
jgi:hypothetical protein